MLFLNFLTQKNLSALYSNLSKYHVNHQKIEAVIDAGANSGLFGRHLRDFGFTEYSSQRFHLKSFQKSH